MNSIKLLTGIVLSLFAATVGAQSHMDIIRYSQQKYTGTARSMAMGSAFGSLGGDFSALSINPAGIATYRSSEFSLTPSLIMNSTESSFYNTTTENKTTFAVNQIGFVGTYKPMREVKKGIISSHFAIGYNRNNNFNYKSMASARNVSTSMTDMFRIDAQGIHPDYVTGYGNLTGLGYNSYLIDYVSDEDRYTAFTNYGETFDQTRIIDKDGYSGEINLTGGINISNILLVGASINFSTLRYKESSEYYEVFSMDNAPNDLTFERFNVHNALDVSGSGINLKVGAIVKPTDQLRLGIAYHSPTWYNIEEEYGTNIQARFFNAVNDEGDTETYARNYDNAYNQFDYQINTPDKLVASASYIIGKKALISFDYEYINYANAKFKSETNAYDDIVAIAVGNDDIKNTLTSTNNFRVGAEYRINQQFSLRGGYSLQESPYKNGDTETQDMFGSHQLSDFKDDLKITGVSGGLGYRNKNYFVDVAYRLSSYDTSYFNYDWPAGSEAGLDSPPKTTVEVKNHYATLTVGWKF